MKYLRFSKSSLNMPQLTTNPDEANVFLIDHMHAKIYAEFSGHCDYLFSDHLLPIVYNVVHDYPYYNRSSGMDHFYIDTLDTGARCLQLSPFGSTFLNTHPSCRASYDELKKILLNVSCIGNFGMDLKSSEKGTTWYEINGVLSTMPGDICFYPDRDIVVPQPTFLESQEPFWRHRETPKLLRQYDSMFAGSVWGDRHPMEGMAANANISYLFNGTERFAFDFNGGFRDLQLVRRAHFMYHPCGNFFKFTI